MCLTLSKYIFSPSKVLWENQSIENFLSQKSCISSQFTPRPNKGHFSTRPNKSSEARHFTPLPNKSSEAPLFLTTIFFFLSIFLRFFFLPPLIFFSTFFVFFFFFDPSFV